MTQAPDKPCPTPMEFYIAYPLYDEVHYDEGDDEEAWEIKYFRGSIDAYCPWCRNHSIFNRLEQNVVYGSDAWMASKSFNVTLVCSRNHEHKLSFNFRVDAAGRTLQKVGQFPSLAELHLFDVRKYSGVLNESFFREFTRAIGLAAHGVGVGSFVYLRRIFESLIELAHQESAQDPTWDEAEYLKGRMAEKIQLLAPKLPEFLVKNRAMYSILSKGIHELSEDECLKAFPVVKVGIEIILDAKIRTKDEQRKLEEAEKALRSLAAEHGA